MSLSMSERFDKLFDRIQLEFKQQTKKLCSGFDDKFKPLLEENKALKREIEYLDKKVEYLERNSKRNNVIIFGLEEKETCISELIGAICKKIRDDLNTTFLKIDINNVYRVGKRFKDSTKPRPVVVTFVHAWRRNEILRNKKRFRNIYVSEDFPKIVVEKRRLWIPQLKEERNKGKIAYLVYDKLLIKPGMQQNMKEEGIKKEEMSEFLNSIEQCEQEEEEKKPRRRAKAMITRNKTQSEEEKNENEKPKLIDHEVDDEQDISSDEESDKKREAEKSRRQATEAIKKNVNFSRRESKEKDEKNQKPKPIDHEVDDEQDISSDEESDKKREAEKSRRQATEAFKKNENFSRRESKEKHETSSRKSKKNINKNEKFTDSSYEEENRSAKVRPQASTSLKKDNHMYVPTKRRLADDEI